MGLRIVLVGMSRNVQFLLSTNDPAALCMVFVNGRVTEVATGEASVLVQRGQMVRWFVRPSRRKASLRVMEVQGRIRTTLFHGVCDPVVGSGVHVVQGRRGNHTAGSFREPSSAVAPAAGA